METESLLLRHERVDDIPLLLGFLQKLSLSELLERHLGSHHLHEGLPNGILATTWIAFVLSEGDHRKVGVQDWAQRMEDRWDIYLYDGNLYFARSWTGELGHRARVEFQERAAVVTPST